MTITVTLSRPPELTPEAWQQRIRRAGEVLDGAGWVFDEQISTLTQALLDADTADKREEIHRTIRATAEVKGKLVQIVNSQAILDLQNDRRS